MSEVKSAEEFKAAVDALQSELDALREETENMEKLIEQYSKDVKNNRTLLDAVELARFSSFLYFPSGYTCYDLLTDMKDQFDKGLVKMKPIKDRPKK